MSFEENLVKKKKDEFDINYFERKIYSQNGEDGILNFIFSKIGTTNKFCVEIGSGDVAMCNTRFLLENGWNGILIDKEDYLNLNFKRKFKGLVFKFLRSCCYRYNPDIREGLKGSDDGSECNTRFLLENGSNGMITDKEYYLNLNFKNEFVTAENVNNLLQKYDVPYHIDLLSIDIDYNTFWVWKAINKIKPRVVVVEYNAQFPPSQSKVVKYDPYGKWNWTNYFGASLLAFVKLASTKGYDLVGCDSIGVNCFFILHEEVKRNRIKLRSIEELYRLPKFGVIWSKKQGWPISNKNMEEY